MERGKNFFRMNLEQVRWKMERPMENNGTSEMVLRAAVARLSVGGGEFSPPTPINELTE